MTPHSSTLAWKIPWTEEPGGLQSMGSLAVGHYQATPLFFSFFFKFYFIFKLYKIVLVLPNIKMNLSLSYIGEGNATHSSVLAWRIPGSGEPGGAAVYGVAQSRTQLKRLSSSSKEMHNSINAGLQSNFT